MFSVGSSDVPIQPETLFSIGGFPFTNSHASGVLLTILLAVLALAIHLTFKKDKTPSKFQTFLEMFYELLAGFTAQITSNKKIAKKVLPLVGTLFIYIGISNVLLLLPGLTALKYDSITVFRTHTLDFNTTFGIATAMVVWMQVLSIAKLNPFGYIFKFIRLDAVYKGFRQGPGPGLLSIVDLFIGALDIVSEFAKIVSLSLRLFGNMYAGELLTSLVLSSFAIILPVPLILIFGLFSGLVQSIVFGSLTAANLSLVLKDE
ncbi:MAG TPA: FoF1 ATP synthase subunit a [Candidatus Dojkabacteria bacterium]|jgi:F-type H+-transporting ATPase subunit a